MNPLPICPDPSNPNNYPIFGPCYQHITNPKLSAIPYWRNITKYVDYHRDSSNNPISASGIPVYEHPEGNPPDCAAVRPTCGTYTSSNMNPICGPPSSSDYIACATSSTVHLFDQNCYQLTTSSINFNVDPSGVHSCRKLGFKNNWASKAWQGRPSYASENPGPPPLSASYDSTGKNILFGGYRVFSSPDSIKYLTLSISSTYILDSLTPGESATHTYSQQTSINRYSGVQTLDACSRVPDQPNLTTGSNNNAQGPFYIGTGITTDGLFNSLADVTLNSLVTSFLTTISDGNASLYSGSYNGTTVNVYDVSGTFTGTPGSILQSISNNFLDSFSCTNYGMYEGGSGFVYGELNTCTITTVTTSTGSVLNYSFSYPQHESGIKITFTATCTLSNPYTAAQVRSDWDGLAGQWDLSNDLQYLFREDPYLTMAPRTYYSEQYLGLSLLTTGYTCSFSTGQYNVDGRPPNGSIYGLPQPIGYQRFGDGCAYDVTWCTNGLGQEVDYPFAYGETCPGYYGNNFPAATPTRWTNIIQGGVNYPSAYMTFQDPFLVGQKWIEVKQPVNGWAFTRPCGWDRWSIDATTSDCIRAADTSGSMGIDLVFLTPPSMTTGDIIFVYDGGVFGGITGVYKVDSVSGVGMSATNQNWTELPSGYNFNGQLNDGSNSGFAAKMKFNTCPGTCGKVQIISATQQPSSSILINIPDGSNLQDGDNINLYNVVLPNTNGVTYNCKVSHSIDPNNFIVAGTLVPNMNFSNAYVEAISGVDPSWASNNGHGYYLMNQWFYKNRAVSQYVDPNYGTPQAVNYNQTINGISSAITSIIIQQACAPLKSVCSPYAIGFSPNGEFNKITSSNVLAFPDSNTFLLDGLFGSVWFGQVQQVQSDYLWQRPAPPCYEENTNPCSWNEDTGICLEDVCDPTSPPGSLYFEQRPYVEAINPINNVLFGVTLPTPIYKIGYYSLSELQNITYVVSSSNVQTPPVQPGVFEGAVRSFLPIWTILDNQIHCVCNHGRWATDYHNRGANCITFGI